MSETSGVCGSSIAPAGWWCSRKAGHDGPCAARPIPAPPQAEGAAPSEGIKLDTDLMTLKKRRPAAPDVARSEGMRRDPAGSGAQGGDVARCGCGHSLTRHEDDGGHCADLDCQCCGYVAAAPPPSEGAPECVVCGLDKSVHRPSLMCPHQFGFYLPSASPASAPSDRERALLDALDKYGRHKGSCNTRKTAPFGDKARNAWVERGCDCGFDAARRPAGAAE